MNKIECLEGHLKEAKTEGYRYFEKHNMASGVRIRKHLQKVKELSQEIRNLVQIKKYENFQRKNRRKSIGNSSDGNNLVNLDSNNILEYRRFFSIEKIKKRR